MRCRINFRSTARFFLSHLRPNGAQVFGGLVCAFATAVLGLVTPFASGATIDALLRGDLRRVLLLVVATIVAGTVSGVLSYGQIFFSGAITRKFCRSVSLDMFRHYQSLPVEFFANTSPGAIISRIRGNVDQCGQAVHLVIFPTIVNAVTLALALIAVFLDNWRLACVTLLVVPAWLLASKPGSARRLEAQRQLPPLMDTHNQVISERLSLAGVMRAKLFAWFNYDAGAYDEPLRALNTISKRLVDLAGVSNIISAFVAGLGPGLILLVGAWLVAQHQATLGTITAFLALQARLQAPVTAFATIGIQLAPIGVALERINELMQTAPEPGGSRTESGCGVVRYEGIGLNRGARTIVRDATFTLTAGRHVALVGPSGSGKTSLCQMLVRFLPPSAGAIYVDGTDITDFNLDALRSKVAYITQEPALLAASIRDNVTYGSEGKSDDDIWEALKVAGLEQYVVSLPAGLDTLIGVGGAAISGGEKQRVILARYLLTERPIWVLDEALSAVDETTEAVILGRLRQRLASKILLVVTHREKSASAFDEIFAIDDGRLYPRLTPEPVLS